MTLRPALVPPALDPAQVARLTSLAEEIVRAIDAGRATKDALARFNADAGTRLTQFDFHTAAASTSPRDFVETVLTPPPEKTVLLDRDAVELVRRLQAGEASARERRYWLALLEASLDQPGIADLIDYPGQQLAPSEVVAVARTCSGSALARNLDFSRRGYHVARALIERLVSRRLLVLGANASVEALARGAEQFVARENPSARQIQQLSEWLLAQPSVEELFADETQLAQHLTRV